MRRAQRPVRIFAFPAAAPCSKRRAMTAARPSLPATALPATFWQAALRGVRYRCPRCGEGQLFRKWLKPVAACGHCDVDITPERADDFPAYIAIIVTGHLLGPLMVALTKDYDLSPPTIFAILIPLAIAMMLGMLQSAKGAVIAAQWWFGMHGFRRERPADPAPEAAAEAATERA